MKIVNGYICDCIDDERLAKKGIDPDNPRNDPARAEELEQRRNPTAKSDEGERAVATDVQRVTPIEDISKPDAEQEIARNEKPALLGPEEGLFYDRFA